jgi:hypothetical protein
MPIAMGMGLVTLESDVAVRTDSENQPIRFDASLFFHGNCFFTRRVNSTHVAIFLLHDSLGGFFLGSGVVASKHGDCRSDSPFSRRHGIDQKQIVRRLPLKRVKRRLQFARNLAVIMFP